VSFTAKSILQYLAKHKQAGERGIGVERCCDVDTAQRKKAFDEVQQIMSEQVPFIYIVSPLSFAAFRASGQCAAHCAALLPGQVEHRRVPLGEEIVDLQRLQLAAKSADNISGRRKS
jgi:hypothetical protein